VEETDAAALDLISAFTDVRSMLSDCDGFSKVTRQGSSLGKGIPNALRKLRSMLVSGLLRVGGRLQNSPLSVDTNHPFILPKRHHVTELIVFIITIRKFVFVARSMCLQRPGKSFGLYMDTPQCVITSNCQKYRLWTDIACGQIMAPLPKCRVTPGFRAFTCTSFDYFGPILVKVGHMYVKRYGCLFTCMASRAVHVEVAYLLNASSFLQAFFRFIHRRRSVRKMFSDRETNFLLAERELREGVRDRNQLHLHESLRQQNLKWYFNPPLSPASGGAWEILVKTVKKILCSLAGERSLDDEAPPLVVGQSREYYEQSAADTS